MTLTKKTQVRIRIGVSTLCWPIWKSWNKVIFNNAGISNFMQVIHMATFWMEEWPLLVPEDQRKLMFSGYNRLLMVTRDFYSRAGWRLFRRLAHA
jgi:hypothetical protein